MISINSISLFAKLFIKLESETLIRSIYSVESRND